MDRKWMTADPLEYELLKENAKKNRQNATEAESVFWSMVKASALNLERINFAAEFKTLNICTAVKIWRFFDKS